MSTTARDAHDFAENLSYADLLEGFADEANLSRRAQEGRRLVLQPAESEGWDLSSTSGRSKWLETIDRMKPNLIVMGFPCTPWCSFTVNNTSATRSASSCAGR